MRRWKPKPTLGVWGGAILLLIVLWGVGSIGMRLVRELSQLPDQWSVNLQLYGELLGLVGLLLLAGALMYRVVGALTLSYEIDRNGLYVHWVGNRAVIPLSDIERVDIGIQGARMPWRLLRGVGYFRGQGRTKDGRRLHLFATRPLSRCLVVQTESNAYAISPNDQDAFVQDLEQRRKLGAIKPLVPTIESGRIFFYAFWSDRVVRWSLLIALSLNLLLLGGLALRYPELAATVEMRFDAAGQVIELRPRHQVLFLPLAAFLLLLLNTGLGLTLYQREQIGARFLQIASIVVQLLFGVAVMSIIIG